MFIEMVLCFIVWLQRFAGSKVDNPAPGTYNDPRTALEITKRVTGLKRSPFGQTSVRFNQQGKKIPGETRNNTYDLIYEQESNDVAHGPLKWHPSVQSWNQKICFSIGGTTGSLSIKWRCISGKWYSCIFWWLKQIIVLNFLQGRSLSSSTRCWHIPLITCWVEKKVFIFAFSLRWPQEHSGR